MLFSGNAEEEVEKVIQKHTTKITFARQFEMGIMENRKIVHKTAFAIWKTLVIHYLQVSNAQSLDSIRTVRALYQNFRYP